jgi:hypothetical protein
MLKLTLCVVAGSLVALGLGATNAQAQSRVFVAAQGSDSNPCTFAAPCRTFQHAHNIVAAGGEIDVLDPAGYGALTITKAISIQGHGFSGISVTISNIAMTINAGAGDKINLRGLLLEGGGIGDTGIQFNTGGSLNIQDCVIRNFQDGFDFLAQASSTLSVSNTVVSDNAQGVTVAPTGSGAVNAIFGHIEVDHSETIGLTVSGVQSSGTVTVSVSDSIIGNNGTGGILVNSTGAPTAVMVKGSTIANNSGGVEVANNFATLRITKSVITGNATGLQASSGGAIVSFGDNSLAGNTADGAPTSTTALK